MKRHYTTTALRTCLTFLIAVALVAPAEGAVIPDRQPSVAAKEFQHPDLHIPNVFRAVQELSPADAATAREELSELGIGADSARIDLRSGRWGTLLPELPLVPGPGFRNDLTWEQVGVAAPGSDAALGQAALTAFTAYLRVHQDQLRIDPEELSSKLLATVSSDRTLIQIHAPRQIDGVPVRDSYLSAVINRGNLLLFGAHQWGDVVTDTTPHLTATVAEAIVHDHFAPLRSPGSWAEPELLLVPAAAGQDLQLVTLGQGYDYRLVWAVRPLLGGDQGRWEGLVDAHDGELLSFLDTNHYMSSVREVRGGVYPLSNDGVSPDGIEYPGWPMPFDNVTTPSGVMTTDSGGNVPACIDGSITSSLNGQYVRINDNCGAISLTSAGDIDFWFSPGDDCVTPGLGGAGNTHSSRTGFFELNRIMEMARGQLPSNTWLQAQLTANMNVNSTCNASWNGTTVNFFRSGGGCANTGEIAAVFDHEWGHGMDDNDANPSISSPGEGIADVYAALRLNDSCIGRGFYLSGTCGGYGDSCTSCTGIREIDYANRASGAPHDVAWIDANCPSGGGTPCGGASHCEGAVYAEAVWDLFNRDLTSSPFFMSLDTAREVTTQLTYLGGGAVGTWFQCSVPFGGCAATGGYLNFLAADDDNATLTDGTPHMGAIYAAFNRHGIACNTPAVVNSGCAGTPPIAPLVAAAGSDRSATLTWTPVLGASGYEIYRTDGVHACAFGKVKVGSTGSGVTTFTDTGLQNGRNYYYIVVPKGPSAPCFGPASSCTSVIPSAAGDPCCDDVLQYGTETIDENVRTVSLSGFTTPIVVMGPPSFNGSHPSTARVLNVTAGSFQHFLQEWDYLDGPHANESIGYLVMESGPSTVGTLDAEAGSTGVTDAWTTVNFTQTFGAAPVVVTQVASDNDTAAVTTRVRNVTATSFQVRLQEEEAADGVHASETVHYVAIETGSTATCTGQLIVDKTGNSVTQNWFTETFSAPVATPVFVAGQQTFDGSDPAALRHRNLSTNSVEVKVEEEQSGDSEVNHNTENVGYFLLGN